VTACIFVNGKPDQPIVRLGNTRQAGDPVSPAYWGPDPSAAPNACSDLPIL
jgi:hypothetical protein